MAPDVPRWHVDGYCFFTAHGVCREVPVTIVLFSESRGYVSIGALRFPLSDGQSSVAFYDQLMTALFSPEEVGKRLG